MRNLDKVLSKRAINYKKLEKYGFEKNNNAYEYRKKILNNQFEVYVSIASEKSFAKVIDVENNEEYSLVDIESATGEFVGTVRQEYENVIQDIIASCTIKDVFKFAQTKEIIEHISNKYGDELEFLWEKFDDNAIWRNKQNNKWYAVLLTVKEEKLGIESDKTVEVIDMMYQKDSIDQIVDNKFIYPGYHMNKKSWITVKLDGTVETLKIKELIDNSYKISIGNKCGMAGDNLAQRVYEYLETIPKGKVVTYKQVAEHLGNKGLARVVGNILHKNPDGDKYPCYKVLNSKGELADAFVFGGKDVQKQRLEKDGIEVIDKKVDLKIYQWK